MSREEVSCQRAISRFEMERSILPVWDFMHEVEAEAKRMIEAKVGKQDLVYDWSRQAEPERFVLRAWCMCEVKNQKIA